ncbi:MAG: DNA mismatch repair endonuclease MutL [Clostridia bacterium]|nr:DNA mismatch repair endonuclease MutL [Clostridia bacterium]
MAKINVLEKHIAELIAAGEVVERPSSVVKELTENAIDAGATSVTVEIKNGGVTYIRVTDNGCGIARDEVPLAFLRHATSKITVQEDLDAIGTLGFRGEALASICAMARVELLTRTADELAGTRYCIEGGDEQCIEDAGCPRGTTIIVRDLFYNTPARMKFLKKDVAEGNAVAGVLDKVALSHPEVSIRMIRDGKETLRTTGDGKLKSAITAVHGKEFAAGLVPVSHKMGAMTVDGFVTKPSAARASRNLQTFFVNGRFVKSQTASAAVEQACRGAVMVGKFPACVLHIRIPAEAVDVNVHPAKIEVRFMTERPVFDVVYRAVCDGLSKSDTPKELQMRAPGGTRYSPAPIEVSEKKSALHDSGGDFIIETPVLRRTPVQEPIFRKSEKPVISFPESAEKTQMPSAAHSAAEKTSVPKVLMTPQTDKLPEEPEVEVPTLPEVKAPARPAPVKSGDQTSVSPAPAVPKAGFPVRTAPAAPKKPERSQTVQPPVPETVPEQQTLLPEETKKPRLKFAGEVFSTYMMLEGPDEIIFIDKHAAHERILFERLKKDTQKQFAQQLLTPATFRPAREEYTVLLEHRTELSAAGFEVEEFGGGVLLVRGAPMAFGETDVCAALTEIAAHLLEHRTELVTARTEWILHNVACRAAIKAGDKSDPSELLALAQMLYEQPELRYCPHGRPIYLSMKRRELEKQFGRIQ